MELHIHISNHLTRNINYLNLSSIHLRIVADHSELKQAVNQLCTPLKWCQPLYYHFYC